MASAVQTETLRCLILGGSGLLGRALGRRRHPAHEIAATHFGNPRDGSIAFDIRESFSLPAGHFDLVVVAIPLAKILLQAPDDAARRFCRGLSRLRAILMSTDAVFSGRAGYYDERAVPDASSDYGRSQAKLDELFLQACPGGLVVRTSFLFGGRAPYFDRRLAPFIEGASQTHTQAWPGNIYRSPTEADFCAEAVWQCVEKNVTGILHVCGERMSIHDFFVRALSGRGDFKIPPPSIERRPDIAIDTSLNPALMDRLLDIDHTSVWRWHAGNLTMKKP